MVVAWKACEAQRDTLLTNLPTQPYQRWADAEPQLQQHTERRGEKQKILGKTLPGRA